MKHHLLAAAAVFGLLGTAATAAPVTYVLSGVLSGGSDTGVFITPGMLTGHAFQLSMTFDPALGLDASGPAGTVRYLGGAANNIPQLPLYTNVSMTINNVTRSMSGWHAALVYSVAGERYLHVNNDPTDANSFKRFAVVIQNPNLAANPANTSNGLTVAGFGAFDWLQGADTPGAAGSWNGGTLSISTAAVPEPASWALLIAGFGLTGATLRRRRALAA